LHHAEDCRLENGRGSAFFSLYDCHRSISLNTQGIHGHRQPLQILRLAARLLLGVWIRAQKIIPSSLRVTPTARCSAIGEHGIISGAAAPTNA